MKQRFILFLFALLFVGALHTVSYVSQEGVKYLFTSDVMIWQNMGTDPNVEPNIKKNIQLLTFWPEIVVEQLCANADSTENYIFVQYGDAQGAVYGGITSSHQTVRYSPVRINLSRQAIAKKIEAGFTREDFRNLNEALYGMYIPKENQLSIFEVLQYGNGFGGYEQCNNITFRQYFKAYTPTPPPPPKVENVIQIDTVYKEIRVEIPMPGPVVQCNPYWEWNGWVEVAGTFLTRGTVLSYSPDEFVNFHANFNTQNSNDQLFFLELKHGIQKSKWVGTFEGGLIDRIARFKITAGHERSCSKEKYQTRLGIGYEGKQYSFYQREYLDYFEMSWIDREQRVIMYYPFIFGKFVYFFNDHNEQLRKALEKRKLPTKNLKKDFQDNVTIYGDIGPNTELFGNGQVGIGKYSVGFYGKAQPRLGINLYSVLNLEYVFYPEQKSIFNYSGADLIKKKGTEVMKYGHFRFGPKLSRNSAVFLMTQYIEDKMNHPANEVGNKSVYIRKDLGVGAIWKVGRFELLFIASYVEIENGNQDNEGFSVKFSLNF